MNADGFAPLPRWMLADESISSHALLTYVALAGHVDEYATAFPSHREIARLTRLSVKSVQRALTELQALGIVEWEQRTRRGDSGQTSNLYRLATSRPGGNPEGGSVTQTGGVGHTDRGGSVTQTDQEREPVGTKPGNDARAAVSADPEPLLEVESAADELLRVYVEERALALGRKPTKRDPGRAARARAREAAADVDAAHLRLVLRWAFTEARHDFGPHAGEPDRWWLAQPFEKLLTASSWDRLEGAYLRAQAAAPAPAVDAAPTGVRSERDELESMLAAARCSPVDWPHLLPEERQQVRETALVVGWRPTRPSAEARPAAAG